MLLFKPLNASQSVIVLRKSSGGDVHGLGTSFSKIPCIPLMFLLERESRTFDQASGKIAGLNNESRMYVVWSLRVRGLDFYD